MLSAAGIQYLLGRQHWVDGLHWVPSPGHTPVSGPQCPPLQKEYAELGQLEGPF